MSYTLTQKSHVYDFSLQKQKHQCEKVRVRRLRNRKQQGLNEYMKHYETIKMNNMYVRVCELTQRDLYNILISF